MPGILSVRLCDKCRIKLHKDPCVPGDYDEEGRLLSYCPECGDMYPALSSMYEHEILSNRKMKLLSARCAMKFNLSYHDVEKIIDSLKGYNRRRTFKRLIGEMEERYGISVPPEIFVNI